MPRPVDRPEHAYSNEMDEEHSNHNNRRSFRVPVVVKNSTTMKGLMMTHSKLPIPYTDAVETVPPDEADDIQRVLHALQQILTKAQAKTGKFQADVHVKRHGCAEGGTACAASLAR